MIENQDPKWPGDRRSLQRGQRAGREQLGRRRHIDRCDSACPKTAVSYLTALTETDVRFKNQGLDAIEVQDNGRGIPKEDYESIGAPLFPFPPPSRWSTDSRSAPLRPPLRFTPPLRLCSSHSPLTSNPALKHHTSKLRTYTDLTALRTFGFRGEALSALAALATLTLTTCTAAAAPSGDLLAFSAAGALLPERTRVVAAQRGTTVRVERLFAPLPVRRHELERNGKREYGKVLALLQAYACVSTGVRVGVSNVMGRGRSVVFATNGNVGVRENVANVFGARAVAALVDLGLELEMEGGGERNDDG